MIYLSVILPLNLNRVLTYSAPAHLEQRVELGCRVSVPLGSKKIYTGVIVEISDSPPHLGINYKSIIDVIDPSPIIPPKQMKVWKWLSDYYLCPLSIVMRMFCSEQMQLKGMIDNGEVIYEKNSLVKNYKVVELRQRLDQQQEQTLRRSSKQYAAYKDILSFESSSSEIELQQLYNIGYSSNIISQLTKKGIIEIVVKQSLSTEPREKLSESSESLQTNFENKVSEYSHNLFARLKDGSTTLFVNHSSTSTQSVMEGLASLTLKQNQTLLLLSADVYIAREYHTKLGAIFGSRVAMYDLSLSKSKRNETLQRISNGGVSIIIATKIGVGLPFRSLDSIVVLQEHSRNHKSDSKCRFSARDSAVMMGRIYGCGVILESITPSLESYHNTQIGKYQLYRPTDGSLFDRRKINIVDKYQIDKKRDKILGETQSRYISQHLLNTIEQNIGSGQSAYIYKNRLGYSRWIVCNHCAYTPCCDDCNISLIYRKSTNELVCPICQKSYALTTKCLRCGSDQVQFMGYGTENIEQKIAESLPLAKVIRIDSDTIKTSKSALSSLESIKRGDFDVIVGSGLMLGALAGTPIHHSAIIDADTLLQSTDFRAEERFFQLSMEMLSISRELTIQTRKSRLPILGAVARRDYLEMYQRELVSRQDFDYPPFTRLVKVEARHSDQLSLRSMIDAMSQRLSKQISSDRLSVSVPFVDKIKQKYITSISIRLFAEDSIPATKDWINQCVEFFRESKYFRNYRITIDVDPY